MSRFCTKHVAERTLDELRHRRAQLVSRSDLGPGNKLELERINAEIAKRKSSEKLQED